MKKSLQTPILLILAFCTFLMCDGWSLGPEKDEPVRNFQQRTEDFNNRVITRRQGNIEGAPSWIGGMIEDLPNPDSNAIRALEDYLCFPDRLEPRGGSQVWSNTTLPPFILISDDDGSLSQYTGYSWSKSGTTVTKTSGTDFTDDLVGCYIVHDSGVHERISSVTNTTTLEVETSDTVATSTAGWIHGPINMLAKHYGQERIVIQIDTRFFISDAPTIGAWYQIFIMGMLGTVIEPTSAYSTYDEITDYLIVFNENGIFKLDCEATGTGADPCYGWKINNDPGTNGLSDDSANTYEYKYLITYTLIDGTTYNRDRTTNDVLQETGPMIVSSNGLDYVFKATASAIASGSGKTIGVPTWHSFNQYSHYSIYRSLDIGVNGIDPQTGSGNNTELFVWDVDHPIAKIFTASQSGATVTSTTDIFTENDIGSIIYAAGGRGGTIDTYIDSKNVTITGSNPLSGSEECRIGAENMFVASQSVTGNEVIGNATVTRESGNTLSYIYLGTKILWADGKTSLIVRWIDSSTFEVAESDVISSTAGCIPSGLQRNFNDIAEDDTLRRRASGFALKNRLMESMPNCNVGGIAGGMIWGAVRGSSKIYYSQVFNNEEYYGGYYRPSGDGAQIDSLPDQIQAVGKFTDRILFYCNQSTWYLSTNDYTPVTTPEIGEVITVATGHYSIADIGLKDYGSIARIGRTKVSDQQDRVGDIMYCSDGSVRVCNGQSFSEDLSAKRIRKTLDLHTLRSAASYDPLNGYRLYRSDNTINDITHAYGFGVESGVQGIGWHKIVNGDPVFPFARIGGIMILDSNGHYRSLTLDSRTGLFYDVSTRDGPTGSGLTKRWKDKVATDGTGGTDVAPASEFIPERGTEDYYTVEHKESHIGTRPYNESDGYPDGLEFTLKIYKNSETTATTQAAGVTKDSDVSFNQKVEGNQLRIRLEANKAEHLLTSRVNIYVAKDRGASPTNRTTTEEGYEKTLNNTSIWVSPWKGAKVINRTTGATITASPTLTTGPDGYSDSGIQISSAYTCPSVNVSSKPLIIWADGTIAITVGGSAVSLSSHGTVGSFTLYYGTATGNGAVVITPSGTRVIADLRILTGTLSTACRTYYFDDVDDNDGKVVFPR